MSSPLPRTAWTSTQRRDLRKIRFAVVIFIFGLVVSGVTAFPLRLELDWLTSVLDAEPLARRGNVLSGLANWLLYVRDGLRATYDAYPFVAYGTDWLAFGHLTIALFFVGPLLDPVRNVFILRAGLWACGFVLPLALICGPLRGIPLGWRLVDCSFGVGGFPLLWYSLSITRRLPGWPESTGRWDGR